jgi:hypothetical protein
VQEIGQPFADEIFRVFANAHPGTRAIPLRASDAVKRMIEYVQRADKPEEADGQLSLLPVLTPAKPKT